MDVKTDDVVTVRIKTLTTAAYDDVLEGWMLDGDDNLIAYIEFYAECVVENLGPLPKRPPLEPMTVGAVVMVDGRRWVRWSNTSRSPWINQSGGASDWGNLVVHQQAKDIQILSTGLTPS